MYIFADYIKRLIANHEGLRRLYESFDETKLSRTEEACTTCKDM